MDAASLHAKLRRIPAGRHRLHQQERRVAGARHQGAAPTDGRPSCWKARSPSCSPRRRAAPARSGRSNRGARRQPSSPARRAASGSVRRDSAGAALLAGALACAVGRARDRPGRSAPLRDLARRAAIYLFPVYEMYRARWQATVNDANPQRQRLNRFRHMPELAGPRARRSRRPTRHALLVGLARSLGRTDVPHRAAGRRPLLQLCLRRPVRQQFRSCQPPPRMAASRRRT